MKELIVLPGRVDSSFFLNELGILTKEFDRVIILSYPVSKEKIVDIEKEYGVVCHIVDSKKVSIKLISGLFRWLKNAEVKQEIKEYFSLSFKGITRVAYILFYGVFALQTYWKIEDEIKKTEDKTEITLYSYWLSRPAYAVAYFADKNSDLIKKTITRAHGYDLYEYRNSLAYLPFRKYIDKNLDKIFFISKDGLNYYQNWREKLSEKKDWADLTVNYLGTYNRGHLQKQMKKKNGIVLASCSSVIPVKRLDLIIGLLEQIRDIRIKWIHIGNGELFEQIRDEAKRRLSHMEILFSGKVDNGDVLKIYQKEDVDYFINLSDSEGIPVSIMEAISMGIPVIARNVGGIREIVNEWNGCLLEQTDGLEKVKDFLRLRVEKQEEYEVYSKYARRFWEQKFNGDRNYSQFMKEII